MAQASLCMQEAKPKPAPQPLPELASAPTRPRRQLLQQDPQTAPAEAADSSDSTSDIRPSNTPVAAPPQTVPEPPPHLKQGPLRPKAMILEPPQDSVSSAAGADERPLPDAEAAACPLQKLEQLRATASAAQDRPSQLEQTFAQPTPEQSRSAPSREESTGISAGLHAQPSSHATPEGLPQLKGAPVRPAALPSRTGQPAREAASISACSDQQETAKPRPQAGVQAASPQLRPANWAQTAAEGVLPGVPGQAKAALAPSVAPAPAPEPLPKLARPAAQQTRGAKVRTMAWLDCQRTWLVPAPSYNIPGARC